jgi:hypothetical protein
VKANSELALFPSSEEGVCFTLESSMIMGHMPPECNIQFQKQMYSHKP